jgi:hypothetical protein
VQKDKEVMKIFENENIKVLCSDGYNYMFNKKNGVFLRTGKTNDDDPQFSPFGPEILDIEISSGGDCLGKCLWCYKSNGEDEDTHNMTFEEFKTIFGKMPRTLMQIAFGIMNISTNPDFFKMMCYARCYGVIPNYTCHGLDVTDEYAKNTAILGGSVAVSVVNKEKTFDAVKKFTDAGVKQVTIQSVFSEELLGNSFDLIDEVAKDPRLKGLKAIVFLLYKAKGRNAGKFTPVLSIKKYKKLIAHAIKREVNIGFDSCSGPTVIKSIEGHKDREYFETLIEPCESGLFSSYINCHGEFFVCSFAEGEYGWKEGIDVLNCNDFMKDVWLSDRLVTWRKYLIENKRNCPIYELCSV